MGLFSKLFGSDGKDIDDALGKMKELADDMASAKYADEDEKRIMNNHSSSVSPVETEIPDGPSGDSWGPRMPDEENQFNSGLSYQDYFNKVLTEAFPDYQIEKETVRDGKDAIFTLTHYDSKKLVVDVRSSANNRYKIVKDCRKQYIPYVRFYYDHDGWWNTKSYVIRRCKEAIAARQ